MSRSISGSRIQSYYAWADPERMIDALQTKRLRARTAFQGFPAAWLKDPKTLPCHESRLAFRDVSRATDTRTVRAALVPPKVFLTNTAPFFLWPRGDEKDQAFLLGVLCSLPLDWYARRFVEIHLNFFVLNPFPVPRPDRDDGRWQRVVALAGRLACPSRRFAKWARAVGVEQGTLDPDEKDDMVRELDAVVALLYGLTEPQLRHIFETFHEGWESRKECARPSVTLRLGESACEARVHRQPGTHTGRGAETSPRLASGDLRQSGRGLQSRAVTSTPRDFGLLLTGYNTWAGFACYWVPSQFRRPLFQSACQESPGVRGSKLSVSGPPST